jgi:ubiquinone/menaquinone biosynthesis C-methylase UbiE
MDMKAYCCTEPSCKRVCLVAGDGGLVCPHGHRYPFVPGSEVPVFAKSDENINEYTRKNAAVIHDNALQWLFLTFKEEEADLRSRLVARLDLKKGAKLLVTGAGAGNDLPYLAKSLDGEGQIFAQDISLQMLMVGVERHQVALSKRGLGVHFSVSDATRLPFADGYFDAAYHFGGINLFADVAGGIAEMNRVVRPGGKVVLGDEGLAPWLKGTEFANILIRNNSLYDFEPPLALLPKLARSVKVTWELSNSFYVIEFTVSDQPLPLDMDIVHLGKRGGSLRTRYFGQLEGVDPVLRDRVYAAAERLGMSRVAYIESLLRSGKPES